MPNPNVELLTFDGTVNEGQITLIDFRENGMIEVVVEWEGTGYGIVFGSLAEMQSMTGSSPTTAEEVLMAGLRWWMARDPDGANRNLILAPKTITIDYGNPVPIKVS